MGTIITAMKINGRGASTVPEWRVDAIFPEFYRANAIAWAKARCVSNGSGPESVALELPDDEAGLVRCGSILTIREMEILAAQFPIVARFDEVEAVA